MDDWRRWRLPIAGFLLLILAGSLYGTSLPRRQRTLGEGVLSEVLAPAQLALSDVYDRAVAIGGAVGRVSELADENRRLKAQVASLTAEQIRLQEAARENDLLRQLLALKRAVPRGLVSAQVIARPVGSWADFLVIDRGTGDGIKPGQPVVAPAGVVGQVMSATAHTARVLLLTSPQSAVGGVVLKNDQLVLVQGRQDPLGTTLDVEPLVRSAEFDVGDVIVTSGLGDVYPKGLPIGRVSGVQATLDASSQSASITPFVDFGRLEWVMVLTGPPGGDVVWPLQTGAAAQGRAAAR